MARELGAAFVALKGDTSQATRDLDKFRKEKLDPLTKRAFDIKLSADDKVANAKLDAFQAKLIALNKRAARPGVRIEGIARDIAEISALELKLDKLGSTAESTGSSVGGLAGPSGMGALIGAGVALAPVIATVATGLAGFGLAAYGVAKPIADAAQKTGGLAANMSKLDPEQQAVAKGILALQKQYDAFQKALAPEVLGAFNIGLHLASGLLHDIQPVAQATGKALDQVLGSVDREFRSGTWQQFFQFMAKTAGPDTQLIGQLLVDLLNDIPPLLEQLQPLAVDLLKVADGAAKVLGGVAKLHLTLPLLGAVVGGLVGGPLGALIGAAAGAAIAAKGVGEGAHIAARNLQRFGGDARQAAIATYIQEKFARKAAETLKASNQVTDAAAKKTADLAAEVNKLADSYNAAISPLLAYTNAQITTANDADTLNAALKTSHDRIGLKTAAERASFSAANQVIQDLLDQAAAAGKSGKGIGAVTSAIKSQLPELEHVKGKTSDYNRLLSLLTGWLTRLEKLKPITEGITILGSGRWVNQATGTVGGLGGHTAKGWLVSGGTPGQDSVPIMAMPGELVVPTNMVKSGAVDHLRGSIPGFAGGGVVGSYSGPLKGLTPWTQHNWTASIKEITTNIATAMSTAFMTSMSSMTSGGSAAAKAYAQALLPSYGWGPSQWPPLLALWARESSWNPWAVNPASGAYGIPQSLGHGHPYNLGDWAAQVRWGESYIAQRYGTPMAAWGHELNFGWYDKGGWLNPGPTLMWNGTGRREHLTPDTGGVNLTVNLNVYSPVGNQQQLEHWLARSIDNIARRGQMAYALRRSPSL